MTHNLPVELTRFIGRDAELVEIERLISLSRLGRLLDMIRQYAEGQLQAAGEADEVRDRHLDRRGDAEGAVAWFQRGVQRMTDDTRDWTAARCLPGLMGALRRLGRADEARGWAARALRIETEFDARNEVTGVLEEQARLVAGSDPGQARELHLEALTRRHVRGRGLGAAGAPRPDLRHRVSLRLRTGHPANPPPSPVPAVRTSGCTRPAWCPAG